MRRTLSRVTAAMALMAGFAACTADEDALEVGDADVPLDREVIEEAEVAPVPPEQLPGVGPTVVDTMRQLDIDVEPEAGS